jgi:hypothetical protein
MADIPSSFPNFNFLPTEIRLMIWEAALPDPRIIHIEARDREFYSCFRVRSDTAIDALDANQIPAFFQAKQSDKDRFAFELFSVFNDTRKAENYFRFITRAPPPVLLYVCRESFEVASRHHPRVFGTAYSPPTVSFNFQKDTLYLDWAFPGPSLRNPYELKDFSWVELAKVRYLAVECDEDYAEALGFENTEEFLAMVLGYFPSLEKLTISSVDAYHSIEDSGDLVFMKPRPGAINRISGPLMHLRRPRNYTGLFSSAPEDKDEDEELWDWFKYTCEPTTAGKVDLEELERYRRQHMAKKGNGGEKEELPPLPEIDWQIITTPAIKERVQTLLHLEAANRERIEAKQEARKTRRHTAQSRYHLRSTIRH